MENQDSVGHIRLDDAIEHRLDNQIDSSIEEMETTMTKTYTFTVTIAFGENDQIDVEQLTEKIDEAVSDRVDNWYSVDVQHVNVVDGPRKFIAEPNFVEKVYLAIEQNNPNDPTTEEWDDEAVQELANYARANDLIEEREDGDVIDELLDPERPECLAYFMYDMIKWTRANNA